LPDKFDDLQARVLRSGYLTTAAVFEPIPSDHEAAEAFRTHKDRLLEELSSPETSFPWRSLDLLIAVYHDKPYPVLLVSLSLQYPGKVESCQQFFKRSDWEWLLNAKMYVLAGRPVQRAKERTILPGGSLSAQDFSESQGTYGGPIMLGGELYALTYDHVVFNWRKYSESHPVPSNELEKAIYPFVRTYIRTRG
jgi:hypothetical protein